MHGRDLVVAGSGGVADVGRGGGLVLTGRRGRGGLVQHGCLLGGDGLREGRGGGNGE